MNGFEEQSSQPETETQEVSISIRSIKEWYDQEFTYFKELEEELEATFPDPDDPEIMQNPRYHHLEGQLQGRRDTLDSLWAMLVAQAGNVEQNVQRFLEDGSK